MRRARWMILGALALTLACTGRGETRSPGSAPEDAAAGEEAAPAEEGALEVPDRAGAEAEARAALPRVPPDAPDFMARQKLVGRYGEREFRAEVVLQKQGDALTLIGLSPFGTKGFVLEQRGDEVKYTSHMPEGRELPFPPVFMLVDVHRSLWLSGQDGPRPDGAHERRAGELVIVDEWRGGLIRARRITPAGASAATVTIEFPEGATYGVPPPSQTLHHHRYGYSVEVRTVQHQPL
ncbi:MAG: DUF3261 domain-containing protein [Myxococcales bacterium]|nr:DUF3261 domain-containing protein [Myxococcales bacterium]